MSNIKPITDLDYGDIRTNLQNYLKGQAIFSDYVWEGSGLSQLLNILAYNTAMNGYLANAVVNESFLDSAVKRGSAISRAKESGYTPRSASSAMGIVNISIPAPSTTIGLLTLEKNTPFTSNLGNTSLTYYTRDSVTAPLSNGAYLFQNVKLYEGTLVQNSFLVQANTKLADLTFTIPNRNIDTTSIKVVIQNSITDTGTTAWNQVTDISNVSDTSQVFFVQCSAQELYQIQFGDGVLGKKPLVGNVVIISYLVTNAEDGNVAANYPQTFSTDNIGGNTGLVINTVQNSTGGRSEESIDEIKFNAPLSYQANNRAVTEEDYLGIISRYASSVKSVTVYGGEKATPPVYGKVYISLEPMSGYYIPDTIKSDIANTVIKSRNVVTVTPEFIDPDYVFLTLTTTLEYDQNKTSKSTSDIVALVQDAIQTYVTTNLGKFRQPFYFSQLSRVIDLANDAILGNVLTFDIQKRFYVAYGQPAYITCDFGSAIRVGTFKSNTFTYYINNELVTASLVDSNGVIQVLNNATKSVILANTGTINYSTGKVDLRNLKINGITGVETQLKLSATPIVEISNILPSNNQIILVDDSTGSVVDNVSNGITVNVTPAKSYGVS